MRTTAIPCHFTPIKALAALAAACLFACLLAAPVPAFAEDAPEGEEPLVFEPAGLAFDASTTSSDPFQTLGDATAAEALADDLSAQDASGWVPFPLEVQMHQDMARQLFNYTNQLRAQNGLPKLVWDDDLEQTALQRAAEALVCWNDDHTRPNGESCFTAFPVYETEEIGAENLAINVNYDDPALTAFEGLRNSPSHLANMLNGKLVSVGMACVAIYDPNHDGWMYSFSQDFASAKGSGMKGSPASGARVFDIPVYDDLVSSMTIDPPTMLTGVFTVDSFPTVTLSYSGGKSAHGYSYDLVGSSNWLAPDLSWSIADTAIASVAQDGNFASGNEIGQTTATVKFAYSSRWSRTIGLTVTKWTRLWGDNAFGTMDEIAKLGWKGNSCDTVVLATFDGYWDALTASGLAGQYECPLLLTSAASLSDIAAQNIERLGAKRVIVVGGTGSVSANAVKQVEKLGVTVERVSGDNAAETALAIYQAGLKAPYKWSKTAIIATSNGYWDALAGAPFSYARCAPVMLANEADGANAGTKLSANTLNTIKKGGFDRIVICGGTSSVSGTVEKQLASASFKGEVKRLAGKTACETSTKIAAFCLDEGMSANGVGIATRDGHWDALTGAALCGNMGAPLVLVADDNRSAIEDFIAKHASDIKIGVVFGGTGSVSIATYQTLYARG